MLSWDEEVTPAAPAPAAQPALQPALQQVRDAAAQRLQTQDVAPESTAFSAPVFEVDFSVCVAPMVRR